MFLDETLWPQVPETDDCVEHIQGNQAVELWPHQEKHA